MANELERSKRIEFDAELEKQINPKNLELLERYLNNIRFKGLSDSTIYNYKRDLIAWFTFINKHQNNLSISNVDSNEKVITADDIEDFVMYCQREGNNTDRIKRRCSSISAFYIFLKKKKLYIGDNPVGEIEKPKKTRPVVLQTYLTLEQVEKIRKWLKRQKNKQYELLFEIGLATMGRVNALSNLTFKDCNLDEMAFENVLEKEGKIVSLFFNDKVKSLLINWFDYRKKKNIESDYVFITMNKKTQEWQKASVNSLQQWIGKIGLSTIGIKLHAHDLRHSGATLLKNAGMSLEDVSSLLNHASTDVTKKFYIKEDESKLAQVYRKFSI